MNFATYSSHTPYRISRKGAAADSEGDAIFLFHFKKINNEGDYTIEQLFSVKKKKVWFWSACLPQHLSCL